MVEEVAKTLMYTELIRMRNRPMKSTSSRTSENSREMFDAFSGFHLG
jgi:hypothetical protein